MALLLEAGLLLVLVPWSAFWDRNYFAQAHPGVREVITNNFVRGAVSGLGVINLFAALSELADVFSKPATSLPGSPDGPPSSFSDHDAP